MKLWNKIGYLGLCAGVAVFSLNAATAWAAGDSDDATITIQVTEPSVVAAAADASFGHWAVINKATGPAAVLTIAPDDTISTAAAGVYPNARFVSIDPTGTVAIKIAFTGGAFNEQLSFEIGNAGTNAGEIDSQDISLVHGVDPVANASFLVNTWNCVVDPAGAYGDGGGTPETFVADPAHATNGLGVITLGTANGDTPEIANAGANIACGMNITTVGTGGLPYGTGSYTGTARVNVDYI